MSTQKSSALSPEIVAKVHQLADKYAVMGQDLRSYLDGLLYADYLTYWDYINLDVLLSLQNPRTSFKDESIFIMYHQITELYFKLSLHAIKQITDDVDVPATENFIKQLKRVNSYFKALIQSFEIMIDGMDKEQFLNFRMSLLPSSGFQSGQYRQIELYATDLDYLVAYNQRHLLEPNMTVSEKYQLLYWKQGATELATGKKTLTLRQFERKYGADFLRLAQRCEHNNLWQKYHLLPQKDRENPELIAQLCLFDQNANVNWPLMHYKSAVRYLNRKPEHIAATGGTNWQKYLPPRFQRISFYPSLHSTDTIKNWGKKVQL